MYHEVLSRFRVFQRPLKINWMLARIHVRRKLFGESDPAELLRFCARQVVINNTFRLSPTMRDTVLYAPKPASEMTEILNTVIEAIASDKKAKGIFELGPFRRMSSEVFLTDKDVELLDTGVYHVVFHMNVFDQMIEYIKRETKPGEMFHRANARIITDSLQDFQKYIDSVLSLYD